ncbi:MAG TPA: CPBP family intramembrane glutamic endopeptidase [Gemmatimonadaceae bacterium]|nr:CPBP family intramembrane glutamic endopeptidase [Gemmatimonadaceae bacterium]
MQPNDVKLDPTATKRAWIFMFGALALYSWPFSFLPRGKQGWAGIAHLLGFGGVRPAPLQGWILAALVTAMFCWYTMRAFPLVRERVFDWSTIKAVALVFAFFSGTMEEIWFRMLAMDWSRDHGAGPLVQILFSAALFGLAHGVWGIFAGKFRVALGSIIATGALGAMLAVVYLTSARAVGPCIWSHIMINVIIEPWLLIAAMSPRATPSIGSSSATA